MLRRALPFSRLRRLAGVAAGAGIAATTYALSDTSTSHAESDNHIFVING